MSKTIVKRKFLANIPAQSNLLFLVLVSILIPVLFVCGVLYFLIFKILSCQQISLDVPGVNIYPIIMKTNLAIIMGLVPLFLLLFAWGAIVSHRFVGPLNRVKREIEEAIEKNDFKIKLGVRKHDYIKPLVDSINKLFDKINAGPPC